MVYNVDNVMIEYNDTVDSRGLQRCADGHHSSLAHASARDKPIREKGRFGYVGAPVTNADWLYGCRRGGSRIFSQGGLGGTMCHRHAYGVSGGSTEGGLGPPPRKC